MRKIIKRAAKIGKKTGMLYLLARSTGYVPPLPPEPVPAYPTSPEPEELPPVENVLDVEELDVGAEPLDVEPITPEPEASEKEADVEPIIVMDELKLEPGELQSKETTQIKNLPIVFNKLPEDIKRTIPVEWTPTDFKSVDERYPLIPPHAYAHIFWKEDENTLVYYVEEPPLTKEDQTLLERIRSLLIDIIDMSAYDLIRTGSAEEYISKKFDEVVDEYGFKLTQMQRERLRYYILRDFVGLERIEPLMRDPQLEDISCIGPGVPIYVYHRHYGSLKTNIVFDDPDDLNRFIVKLAQMCGRHVSVAEPLLQGALPDGSRVQATYAITKDISTKGSSFSIRKFTKDPLTITDLMRFGTLPSLLAAYLWLAVERGQSILIAGGTATGKTTLLNTLALFIPPEAKVISIEDTPELRLPHEHWSQKIARETERGGVTMFDLLKAALRERPDYIVVGEVRGKEAYVLFQGMATGHPGLATIHAEDMDTLVDRLTTPPISLPVSLLHSLDIIIFMTKARVGSVDVRRIREIYEVTGVDISEKRPLVNKLVRWIPAEDKFEFVSDRSVVVDRIVENTGISAESIWSEIRRRQRVLEYLKNKNIRYYKDVGRIIARYYRDPEGVLEEISRDTGSE